MKETVSSLRAPESWAQVLALPWVSYMNSNWSRAICTVLNNTALWDKLRPWTTDQPHGFMVSRLPSSVWTKPNLGSGDTYLPGPYWEDGTAWECDGTRFGLHSLAQSSKHALFSQIHPHVTLQGLDHTISVWRHKQYYCCGLSSALTCIWTLWAGNTPKGAVWPRTTWSLEESQGKEL